MMEWDINTVVADINATGFDDKGRIPAIRYVKANGEITEMRISKRGAKYKKGAKTLHLTGRSKPNMKERALIPIISHENGKEVMKNIFMYGIIAYNRDGDFEKLYTIKRGLRGTANK